MGKKTKLAVENPVSIGGTTIIPVVMTSLYYHHIDGIVSLIGFKQPVNLVVVTPTSRKAFRITGEEILLDQLIAEVPDLERVLGKLDNDGEGSR